VSLSLGGHLNYLDRSSGKVSRIVKGHQKAITALTVDPQDKTLYSGSYDGRVLAWSSGQGGGRAIEGSGHSNQVTGMTLEGQHIYTVGMDDAQRSFRADSKQFE
jgi:WD40 repeat protein